MTRWNPPFPPYDPRDVKSFSYDTVVKRWPVILTGLINDIIGEQERIRLSTTPIENAGAKNQEGIELIRKISQLKSEMGKDRALPLLEEDGGSSVKIYNEELERLKAKGDGTWFTAPWLYAECYLYRLVRTYFANSTHWKSHDPFLVQKNKTFTSSSAAIHKLAQSLIDLDGNKEKIINDEDALRTLLGEMMHMCLWGNATDLSLLTTISHEEIQRLQTVSKSEQQDRAKFILRDDGSKAWDVLKAAKDKKLSDSTSTVRVDFVLDNAGFELYTDLIFAEFLLDFMGVDKVVFHPKAIPWFVSDVTPPDFKYTIQALQDPSLWSSDSSQASENSGALSELAKRFQTRVEKGEFELSVPIDTPLGLTSGNGINYEFEFWTECWSYQDMGVFAPKLLEYFRTGSALVIFKGDLNYRKLTGDIKWPATTPFSEVLGPLRGHFPILSLRTNKADVIVGLAENVLKEVEEKEGANGSIKWRVDGRYAVISFEPKA